MLFDDTRPRLADVKGAPPHVLPTIVVAQFCGTSVWFAGNAVAGRLISEFGFAPSMGSSLASAVQLGFVFGTLVFAVASLADRISAPLLFLACASLGGLTTACMPLVGVSEGLLLGLRCLTGFFLAGVYPVGMKIAASWFGRNLGRALGYLVGALVLGTAFPHAVSAWVGSIDVRPVCLTVGAMSLAGGVALYLLVPEGPLAKTGARFDPRAIIEMFSFPRFRAAALGYFGHMWELYAFWATVPVLVARLDAPRNWGLGVSASSFVVIAVGALGCIVAGERSLRRGPPAVAARNLGISGVCCLLSPLLFHLPSVMGGALLLLWGFSVVADSAQFSSIAATGAPSKYVGSALTWMTCLGFALTIASVELLGWLTRRSENDFVFLVLAPGPAVGLWAMRSLLGSPESKPSTD